MFRAKTELSLVYALSLGILLSSACFAEDTSSNSTPASSEATGAAVSANDEAKQAAKVALSATKDFKHAEMNFSLSYPANWESKEIGAPFLIKIKDPSNRASISAVVEATPPGGTSAMYAKAVEAYMNKIPENNYKILSEEEITLCGAKAVKRLQTMGDHDANQLAIYLVKDGKSFSIHCTAFLDYFKSFEPVFNKFIESVKL